MSKSFTLNPMKLYSGLVVRHFKREFDNTGNNYLYLVLGEGHHTETKERFVVYVKLDDINKPERNIWVRPYNMFMSEVDKEKYPNIKQQYRFIKHDFNDDIKTTQDLEDYRIR